MNAACPSAEREWFPLDDSDPDDLCFVAASAFASRRLARAADRRSERLGAVCPEPDRPLPPFGPAVCHSPPRASSFIVAAAIGLFFFLLRSGERLVDGAPGAPSSGPGPTRGGPTMAEIIALASSLGLAVVLPTSHEMDLAPPGLAAYASWSLSVAASSRKSLLDAARRFAAASISAAPHSSSHRKYASSTARTMFPSKYSHRRSRNECCFSDPGESEPAVSERASGASVASSSSGDASSGKTPFATSSLRRGDGRGTGPGGSGGASSRPEEDSGTADVTGGRLAASFAAGGDGIAWSCGGGGGRG
jgi:hypothetical protein